MTVWTPKTRHDRVGLKALLAALVFLAAGALSACNTTEGVGKDLKSTGKGIEEAAQDAKN